MPIGPAKLAEPHPGLSADIPVLAAGSGAVVALLLARAAWPAWRQAAARFRAERGAARVPGRRPGAVEWLTPVPLIILMIPAAIAAANLIAIQPGRLSARLNTAAVLRAE